MRDKFRIQGVRSGEDANMAIRPTFGMCFEELFLVADAEAFDMLTQGKEAMINLPDGCAELSWRRSSL